MESLGIVIAFYVLSAITIVSALAVFFLRNLVHAIVLLVLAFLGMAGLFLTLSADFIAISQILIYAGAISVLLVFAVMLTPLGSRDNANSLYINIGAPVGFLISLLIGFMAWNTSWNELSSSEIKGRDFADTIREIGNQLLDKHLLSFEVASVLLLFALVGAIILVKEVKNEKDDLIVESENSS